MKPVSVKVGNARLLKLAAFLRKLPRKRFDYTRWVGPDWKGSQDLSCGTTGCALGWAAAMPAFQKLGLRFGSEGTPTLTTDIWSEGWGPYTAVRKLFALQCGEAWHLFAPSDRERNATPKYVARKIERFVKSRAS